MGRDKLITFNFIFCPLFEETIHLDCKSGRQIHCLIIVFIKQRQSIFDYPSFPFLLISKKQLPNVLSSNRV